MHYGNPCLDPMVYPMLFPYGDYGYSFNIFRSLISQDSGTVTATASTSDDEKKVTQLQFYCHKLHVRAQDGDRLFNPLFRGKKLFQQYCVDAWIKTETERLVHIKKHQHKFHVEKYCGLMDFIGSEAEKLGLTPGQAIVLPSSFCGSERALQQHYQDAMAMVAKFGKPDYFITFTCNPNWTEIQSSLLPGQTATDRPDIVARVFNIKSKAFIHDLTKNKILGDVVAYNYVIEFQKRGLPHMHLLLIVAPDCKPNSPEKIDAVVQAEIPCPQRHPTLHELVKNHMIHGPCGSQNMRSSCMQDSSCTKQFPKPFVHQTRVGEDAFPQYRRRDNSDSNVHVGLHKIDNSWVVPYNATLLLRYDAHINVEICSSVKSVKYIYKYIYKGPDRAVVVRVDSGTQGTLNIDEVQKHIDGRYVSAPEAIWRLFSYDMHGSSHSVHRLAVHLELEQQVVYVAGEERRAVEEAFDKKTTLTAWFELNKIDEFARTLRYPDIPYHYTFHKSQTNNPAKQQHTWTKREARFNLISRMYNASPQNMEHYCLRLLLLHVKGCKDWDDIRKFEGRVYPTYKEAAVARRLLDSDKCWEETLEEAASFRMPPQLRTLFAIICSFGGVTDAPQLWDKFKEYMIEDYLHQRYDEQSALSLALSEIRSQLRDTNLQALGLPSPGLIRNPREPTVDIERERETAKEFISKLNPEQKIAVATVIKAVSESNPVIAVPPELQDHVDHSLLPSRFFFLDGPGGTGKTFFYHTIISIVKSYGCSAVSVAPTGIAASLLPDGQTAHSRFGFSTAVHDTSMSSVTEMNEKGRVLRDASIVIWDEISMTSKHLFHGADRALRVATRNKNETCGGKVMVAGGDFRQQLPVIRKAGRAKVVESCVKASPMWELFKPLKLHRNMRTSQEENDFAQWLLQLGDGKIPSVVSEFPDDIEIPDKYILKKADGVDSIVDVVFGKRLTANSTIEYRDKAILCPLNVDALQMNEEVLARLDGEAQTYCSIDEAVSLSDDISDPCEYATEFLNSLTPSGMAPHKLNVKPGCIIMLLWNLNPKVGLCNGTRMVVQATRCRVLVCKILLGRFKDNIVLIPRIKLTPTDDELPFKLSRTQFPVRLGFAMTISKSQGQTLQRVGIYLPKPVFSHGQLYTAFSRVTSEKNVVVQIGPELATEPPRVTSNIVYQEVLQDYL